MALNGLWRAASALPASVVDGSGLSGVYSYVIAGHIGLYVTGANEVIAR